MAFGRIAEVGADLKATTVSASGSLALRGRVLLRVTLIDVSGKKARHVFNLFILRAGSGSWPGAILGAPVLDAPPLGLGHRATLCGHVLTGLGMTLPRLEDACIQRGLRGATVAAVAASRGARGLPMSFPAAPALEPALAEPLGTEADKPMLLFEEAGDFLADDDSPCGGGRSVAEARDSLYPVVLDGEDIRLGPGEAAFVPATAVE